jgi:hypothetical protein
MNHFILRDEPFTLLIEGSFTKDDDAIIPFKIKGKYGISWEKRTESWSDLYAVVEDHSTWNDQGPVTMTSMKRRSGSVPVVVAVTRVKPGEGVFASVVKFTVVPPLVTPPRRKVARSVDQR